VQLYPIDILSLPFIKLNNEFSSIAILTFKVSFKFKERLPIDKLLYPVKLYACDPIPIDILAFPLVSLNNEAYPIEKLLSHSRENTGYERKDKNSNIIKGNINIHNIDKICDLGKQNKLDYKIDGYKQIDYKINSIEKITEKSSMFNIKNNNIPLYDLNKPIPKEFLDTLLKK
jgi:hypothetical protein